MNTDNEKIVLIFAPLVFIAIVIFFIGYNRSFKPFSFQVIDMNWQTQSELYHYETECSTTWNFEENMPEQRCDTDRIIDEYYEYNGVSGDDITYFYFANTRYDQHTSYNFYSNISLKTEEKTVIYHAQEGEYKSMNFGMYCYGDIGWFDHVQNINCSGR